MNIEELQFALENGIINSADILTQIDMTKRKKILEKHPYRIWQGNNGYWYTYVLSVVTNNRVLIKKKTIEDLEDAIVMQQEVECYTFQAVYYQWLFNYKKLRVSKETIGRIHTDYRRYYESSKIVNKDIRKITTMELDIFLHTLINEYQFNKKQFYNMAIIFKQVFEYAYKMDIIKVNVYEKVEIARNVLVKQHQKRSSTEVFNTEEKIMLENALLESFSENNKDTRPASILLVFQTGLRAGELVALKWSDIDGDYLEVQRTEIKYRVVEKDGSMKANTIEVRDFTKGSSGTRRVYLTPKAKMIFEQVKAANEENGLSSSEDYIFLNQFGRMRPRTIDSCLRTHCRKCDIPEKSMHRIRKTFISTLIDAGLNIDEIRTMVGHEDAQTTYRSYCFNRLTNVNTRNVIEKAL